MRLVVFDNAESPQVVQDWLSRILPAKFLVTSYQTIWLANLGLQVRELKTLEIYQSKELLCKLAPRLKEMSDKDLDELANRLDNLPLALDLAGRYLALNPDTSPSDYLTDLEYDSYSLEHTSLKELDYGPSPTNHVPLGATVSLSWRQLDDSENGVLAKRIFRVCGYCAPNKPIPRKLLEEALGTEVSKQMLSEALMKLDRLGLTIPTEGGRMLHGLLAEFARLKDQDAGESVLPALADAMVGLTTEALKSGLPENMKPLRKHLVAVAQAAEKLNLPITGALYDDLGIDLQSLGNFEGAKEKYEQALEIETKVYGPDHPDVAMTLNNLGLDLQSLGEVQKARKCFEESLKIFREKLGEDHPDINVVLDNLN